MKLSVIILNYNVRYFLEQTIVSTRQALKNIDSEIIVVDNDSKDDSCEMMKVRFPEITLIENKENVGFSKANNQAVAIAKGEYICLLNPDTAVTADTFRYCLRHAETNKNLGAIGVYMMDGTGNFLPESKRNVPTPKRSLLKLIGMAKNKNSYYAMDIKESENGAVDILAGAFMFMKREVFNEVNGLDDDYFMYGEDIDLSYKIIKAGYTNYYLGGNEILHYKGESTSRDSDYLDRFYGAMKIFYNKHFNPNVMLKTAVNLGIFLVKKFRGNSADKRKRGDKEPKEAYLLTENFQLLKMLSEVIQTPLHSASKAILQDKLYSDTLFIFDTEYMPYSQIFMVMKAQKNRNNRFRIRPPGCNFIVGSDKSDQKGEVIVF
ncbi:glycosyltransferase family 2 protein [Constantimarinum furrinae]|uniref:Glycosyl transferase family 2 n=1 Tax=Constantimarinum furrinae TaxID=2562285 RepID=A0A7G8PVC9_9FLAO|nr:glycosyltransferase family 2 protein [Constantimarinum furrinae]QNJ98295.1 glycosyl transferase family 2 [Constantimarinum furrinae]